MVDDSDNFFVSVQVEGLVQHCLPTGIQSVGGRSLARTLCFLSLLAFSHCLYAQKISSQMHDIWEHGLPYITNFTSQDYKADLQNWSITQDNNGVIYVGNTSGILEYDGTRWRHIQTPRGAPVKSLAKDPSGRIYVGGVGELGYLEQDPQAGIKFHSLLDKLDGDSKKFNDIWFTYSVDGGIYFVTDTHIIRWAENKFKVWKDLDIGFSWIIRGDLYVQLETGLIRFKNGEMKDVQEGKQLFKDKSITMLLPRGENGFMAISNENECFFFDHTQTTKISQKIPAGFAYNAIALPDGGHLLATLNGGVYFLNSKGIITKHLTKKDGLNTDTIISAFMDAAGDVWLAGDNGIIRLELNSSLRIFDEHMGVDEDIDAVAYFNNELYITTISGLYQLKQDDQVSGRKTFKKVEGVDFQTFFVSVMGDELLVCNFYGLFTVDKNHHVKRLSAGNFQVTSSPAADSTYILYGTADSMIGELSRKGHSWEFGKNRIKIEGRPYRISQLHNGNVFISTRYNGVYEIRWSKENARHNLNGNYSLIHYDTLCGLPSLTLGPLSIVKEKIYVPTTDGGPYNFNEFTNSFQIDSSTVSIFNRSDVQAGPIEAAEGNDFWIPTYRNYETTVYKVDHDKLNQVKPLGRLSNLIIETIYDSHAGIVFLGSDRGLIAYDHQKKIVDSARFPTVIRKITLNKDSTIFAGQIVKQSSRQISIPYKDNNLSFEFALPSYDISSRNEFQYYLEGFDEKWSEWSATSKIDFTNLLEGDYVFHVRARNVYGDVAEAAAFNFMVSPPWHRTWWAYTLYGIISLGVVALIVQWRSANLQREKLALEAMIDDRTEKITVQAEKLQEMDRTKSRFYANISHEFRTPLTLIIAPLDEAIKKGIDHDRDSLILVRRNAERLLELVNQLLDLSKLDAGKMSLHVRQHNIISFVNIITGSFKSWANTKEVAFEKYINLDESMAWYDQDKVEKMVTNLLANAFKFTRTCGTVTLTVANEKRHALTYLIISVSNNGELIPAEEQEQIFSPFYQTKQTSDGQESGTGLGLSLVKELVSLHKGTITLISNEDSGTTFTLELPVSEEAFESEEIDQEHIKQEGVTSQTPPVYHYDEDDLDPLDRDFIGEEKDTLVIVEDNSDLRTFISSILQPQFTVYAAQNGEEGVALTLQKMPNLVLSDLMMPRLDGMQLTERIKGDERTSHIPVILLTAKNESRSKMDGLKVGADDYLTKPFSAEELLVRITNLIDQRKKLSVLFRERILVEPTVQREHSMEDKFLLKVRGIIEDNIGDVLLSVETLSEEMSMSRTQLLRKLKALTGLSPNEFIKDLRLKRAADLIRQKADTITQIGFAVGFNDQSYFTKCFKKQYGVTPKEFAQS